MAGKSLSRAVRKELLAALRGRYARASKKREGRDSERVRSSIWLQP